MSDELKDVLEKAELTIKLSLQDSNTIHVEPINTLESEKQKTKKTEETIVNNSAETKLDNDGKESKKENIFFKILNSTYRVFEEFLDSMARKLLKEKYKWNYSVYNDGKKAVIAMKDKDIKTFLKKGTDAILYTLKKIPASVKKVIKNTKNIAIDEIFSWNDEK